MGPSGCAGAPEGHPASALADPDGERPRGDAVHRSPGGADWLGPLDWGAAEIGPGSGAARSELGPNPAEAERSLAGAPGRSRTCYLMLRRHALYPVSYRRTVEPRPIEFPPDAFYPGRTPGRTTARQPRRAGWRGARRHSRRGDPGRPAPPHRPFPARVSPPASASRPGQADAEDHAHHQRDADDQGQGRQIDVNVHWTSFAPHPQRARPGPRTASHVPRRADELDAGNGCPPALDSRSLRRLSFAAGTAERDSMVARVA